MTKEELQELADYAHQEMMDYCKIHNLDPQTVYIFRNSTHGQKVQSTCGATTDFQTGEDGHGIAPIAKAEDCSFDWTPSPGGTGGVVWHYSAQDGWKFVQAFE